MTLSSDIIHPQDRGGPENGFVETWAERKARQPVSPKRSTGRKAPPNSRRSDPHFRRQVLEMRKSGFTIARIAKELGVDPRTVGRAERAYGLDARIDVGSDQDMVEFKFDLPYALFKAMHLHCAGRYRSKAHFVRTLLRERLG